MFHKVISATPFTTGAGAGYFENITGSYYRSDVSLISTVRAILKRRVPEGETVGIDYGSYSWEPADVDSAGIAGASTRILQNDYTECSSRLKVFSADGSQEGRDALFALLDRDFTNANPAYAEAKDIEAYCASVVRMRIYVNEEAKETVVVVDSLNVRKYHLITSFVARYFPWYCKGTVITDKEKELFRATVSRTGAPDFERITTELFGEYDLREYIVGKVLGGFERRSRSRQLEAKRRQEENLTEELRSNEATYKRIVDELYDVHLVIDGILAAMDGYEGGEKSELMEYFLRNKTLVPLDTDDSSFSFIVKSYIDSYDPEMYETMAKNPGSHINRGYDINNETFRDIDSRRMLLNALFSDEPLMRVKCCAFYRLNLSGEVQVSSGYNYPADCSDRLPNPHLQYHSCLGDHKRYIREALRKGDIVGAVEQCVSSAKSVNIGEAASMNYFLRDIFGSDKPILEMCDGSGKVFTPAEALAYLKERSTPAE